MMTLFALPKPFRGHINVIQRNAIASWTRLSPRPEIILFGNEDGTAQIAREFGLRHVPEVRCNERGTPFVSDLFEEAQDLATCRTLCYVNADILLFSDFMKAVERVASWRKRFLMVGRRTDLSLDQSQDFDSPQCEARLRRLALEKGTDGGVDAIDYFVFSRGVYASIPPLALGRQAWDNWLIWSARMSRVAVVDASAVVCIIHQNHDYSHHPRGEAGVKDGEEAMNNRKLVGANRAYTLDHATHKLTATGIKWDASRAVWRCCLALLRVTAPVRRRLGLRRRAIAHLMGRIGLSRS
jgi:hypothetical protein